MDRDRDSGGASANNSSDFVRKLYKMLEESEYSNIVRWGDDGDSFVVLENDTFTKNVLPRHFKHSNFASFVRQLNKYDFHKVRQNNEDNGVSSYGSGAWEFKHPEFQRNGKESLDNIRRKAPAPRKTTTSMDDSIPAQQVDLLNTQLSATQAQFQVLQDKYTDLAQGHIVLLSQTLHLQKIVKNHDVAMHRVMSVLHILESQNRRLSRSAPFGTNGTANGIEEVVSQENGVDDHIETPLRQAADVLGEYSVEDLVDKELEQMHAEFTHYRNMDYSTPPQDPNNAISMTVQNTTGPGTLVNFNAHGDTELVYPIGQTRGIDPINKDHRNNIPYSLPGNNPQNEDVPDPVNSNEADKRSKLPIPSWGYRKPRVMLVEDDRMCQRIGSKFLSGFNCSTILAKDGLEAVGKINNTSENERIDVIFMDIIMPNLDGVSATSIIREMNITTPIIAMTSNIRTDDVEMYFRYGMNDVLPKPFTKEGMLRCLEKHLQSLKLPGMREYGIPVPNVEPHPGYITPGTASQAMGMGMSQIPTAQSIKDDSPVARSPATSWPSPNSNSMTICPSPISAGASDGYNMHAMRQGTNGAYVMGGTMSGLRNMESTVPQTMTAPRQGVQHRRVMSDMTNGPEEHDPKRQRMGYIPQQQPNSNTFA